MSKDLGNEMLIRHDVTSLSLPASQCMCRQIWSYEATRMPKNKNSVIDGIINRKFQQVGISGYQSPLQLPVRGYHGNLR